MRETVGQGARAGAALSARPRRGRAEPQPEPAADLESLVGPDTLPADLRAILGGIAAGVTVQDEAGRLLFVNDDAARLSGFDSPAEMMRAPTDEVIARFELVDLDGEPFDQSLFPGRRLFAGREAEPTLVGFRMLATGVEQWSMLHARLTTLADGRRIAINTFHDVTSRIETERTIRASEARSRELATARQRDETIARQLADAALALEEARDVESVALAAARAAVPVVADWCAIGLVGTDGTFGIVATTPAGPAFDTATAEIEALSGDVIERGTPRIVPHAGLASSPSRTDDSAEGQTIDALIIQPLLVRGETRGTVAFGALRDRPFDAVAIAAASELATRAGLAIADLESYAAEQRARRAAEALADRMERLQAVTRTLVDATTIDEVAATVADEACRALDATSVTLALLDETASRLDVIVGQGASATMNAPRESSIPLDSDGPLAGAVRDQEPRWIERHSAADGGSACAVPLVADQIPIGGLSLSFAAERVFSSEDRRLVRAYADLAAGAIARLRLGAVRHLLLAANEAERARLESVLRRMPFGVILAGVPDGKYLYANDAAKRLSPMPVEIGDVPEYGAARGYDADGVELDEDDWPLRRAMRGETLENQLLDFAYRDGSRRTYRMSAAPIPGPNGEIEAAVVTFADVSDRVRAQARERFLARASDVLASSLDYEQTVQAVADLAVPAFADWCVVHLASEEGAPHRIAVAHRDPNLVALATQVQEEYPPDPQSDTGVAGILRSGKSEFMAEVAPELIDAAAQDDRHRDMLRALSLRSFISVPLTASGRVTGVLTLVGSEGRPRFEPADVTFAEALAARAAAAIENARLFREGVRFKRLLDATGDAILMLDPETRRITYANRGAAAQFDRSVDELLESTIDDLLEPRGRATLASATSALSRGETDARTMAVSLVRPDGSTLPIEVRLEAVAPDGSPARVLAIARDIRDRIQSQERLRGLAAAEHARAAELNAVIRAMGDGVVVCDPEGRILLANPAAEDVFPGVDETTYDEILEQLHDPDDVAPALGARGGPVELRVRDGDERWIEVSTWPVGAGRDRTALPADETIVLLRDVTEQRQRQAVRDTFIGVLSHELRTPVTTIYAGAKVLSRPGDLPEETRQEIFSDIVIESERLHRLVEDVVAMTRFGEESEEVGEEPVLLQRLLPGVIASEQTRWPAVAIKATVPLGLPTVFADPTYVEQVVRNLVSNAAKYGGPGAAVTALVERTDREVLVRVLDDGPGFPADEAERLFELFFRSARTARTAAGAGIGLFVCARLIRAMGGRIWAANRPEGGAEFGFALRIMEDD